jgi:hypothetical protein
MNDFNSIATGDESWFQHITAFSKIFSPSAANIIPRTQQAVGAKTMITVSFTLRKLSVLDSFPKGSTFNQLYFINSTFPDLKTAKLNFRRQKTGSTFWVDRNNSMCHNRSMVMSQL